MSTPAASVEAGKHPREDINSVPPVLTNQLSSDISADTQHGFAQNSTEMLMHPAVSESSSLPTSGEVNNSKTILPSPSTNSEAKKEQPIAKKIAKGTKTTEEASATDVAASTNDDEPRTTTNVVSAGTTQKEPVNNTHMPPSAAVTPTVDPIVMAIATKPTSTSLVGLVLKDHPEAGVIINNITPTSIFRTSPLRPGMKIISINDIDCQFFNKAEAANILKNFAGDVTIWAATDTFQEERGGNASYPENRSVATGAPVPIPVGAAPVPIPAPATADGPLVPPAGQSSWGLVAVPDTAKQAAIQAIKDNVLIIPPRSPPNPITVVAVAPPATTPTPIHPRKPAPPQQSTTSTVKKSKKPSMVPIDAPPKPSPTTIAPPSTNASNEALSKNAVRDPNLRTGRWTPQEHELFLKGLAEFGNGAWRKIAEMMKTRTNDQVRTHAQKYYDKMNLNLKGEPKVPRALKKQMQQQKQQQQQHLKHLKQQQQQPNNEKKSKQQQLLLLQQQQQQQQQNHDKKKMQKEGGKKCISSPSSVAVATAEAAVAAAIAGPIPVSVSVAIAPAPVLPVPVSVKAAPAPSRVPVPVSVPLPTLVQKNKAPLTTKVKTKTSKTPWSHFTVGSRVKVRWNDQEIYPGIIQKVKKGAAYVIYEDGQEGWEKIKDCSLLEAKEEPLDGKWYEAFRQLQAYKQEHGNANPPSGTGKLSNWLNLQRERFYFQQRDKNYYKKLSPKQVQMLQAIGSTGFEGMDDDPLASADSTNPSKHTPQLQPQPEGAQAGSEDGKAEKGDTGKDTEQQQQQQQPQAQPEPLSQEESEEDRAANEKANFRILREVLLEEIASGRIVGPPAFKKIWEQQTDHESPNSDVDICGLPKEIASGKVPVDVYLEKRGRISRKRMEAEYDSDSEGSYVPRFDHWGPPKNEKRVRKPSAKAQQHEELVRARSSNKRQATGNTPAPAIVGARSTEACLPARSGVVTPETPKQVGKKKKKRTLEEKASPNNSVSPSSNGASPSKKRKKSSSDKPKYVRLPVAPQIVEGSGRGSKKYSFDDRLAQLSDYKEKHGNVIIPTVRRSPYYRLGVWLAAMRSLYKRGDLRRERLLKFRALGCVGFGGEAEEENTDFDGANVQDDNNDDTHDREDNNVAAGGPAENQNATRKDVAADVPAENQNVTRKLFTFEERLSQLVDYKEKHGHVAVPTVRNGPDVSLGLWLSAMRSLYKKGGMKHERLIKFRALGCLGFGGGNAAVVDEPQNAENNHDNM